MPLESGTYISDLNASNPVGATDQKSQGDDHLRLIKSTLLATFPSITGAVSLTHTQINNAVIKNEANELTHSASGSDYALKFKSALPGFVIEDTSEAADEKVWDFLGLAGDLTIRTRTDAYGAGETPFQITRTGTTVDEIRLSATNVSIRDGNNLQILNGSNAHGGQFAHNGTHLTLTATGTLTDFRLEGGIHLRTRGGGYLIANTVDNAAVSWQVTPASAAAGATVISATGVVYHQAPFYVRAGDEIRGYGPSNLDYWQLAHDGTDANMSFNGTNALNIQTVTTINTFVGAGTATFALGSATATGEKRLRLQNVNNVSGVDFVLSSSANTYGVYDRTATAWTWQFQGASSLHTFTGAGIFTGNLTVNGASIDLGTASLITDNDTADEVGFKGTPQRSISTGQNLALSDAGRQVYLSGGSGQTLTIPANSATAFPVGTVIVVVNDSGNNWSIAITTDTLEQLGTGATGTRTLADNGKAVLEKVGTTSWKISGVNLS